MPIPQKMWRPIQHISIAILLLATLAACGERTSRSSTTDTPDTTVTTGAPGNTNPLNTSNPSSQTHTNTPPEITGPDFLILSYNGIPSNVGLEVSDADNNTVRVIWTMKSSPANGDLLIEHQTSFLQARVSATVVGEYVIGIEASDSLSSTYKDIRVQVVNKPPEVGGVIIKPDTPSVTSVVTAIYSGVIDTDEDNLTIEYLWRINSGDAVVSASSDLPDVPFTRGDSISVEIVVTDGTNEVRTLSPEVIVENSPPQLSSVNLSPLDARGGDVVTANVSDAFDADGDEHSSTFHWYINGDPLFGQNSSVLPSGIAKATDIVTAEVTITDGFDSTSLTSDELQIADTPSYLVVEPAQVQMNHGSPSSFTARFVDDDGDAVQTDLVQAPNGLTYDTVTATATWTPSPVMPSSEGNFYAKFSSSD